MVFFLLQEPNLEADMVLDFLFLLRYLTVIVYFYLTYQVGRRIKEVGLISATTGMTLYLLGDGLFQGGDTILERYPTWPLAKPLSMDLSFVYFFFMTFFCIFAEIEKQREFPAGNASTSRYIWSKVALIGLVGFSIVAGFDLILLNVGFLYMVIPFVFISYLFMKRFAKLEMMRDKHPIAFVLMGLNISGFSNFLFFLINTLGIVSAIQCASIIIGILLLVHGWSLVPPMRELKWYLNLTRLLVIQSSRLNLAFFVCVSKKWKGGK